MTTPEKVAYLKGLCEGLGIDSETKDGKILNVILEILSDLSSDVEDLEANAAATAQTINEISEDLSYVEELADAFDIDDSCDDDFDDVESCGYNCSECGICDDDMSDDCEYADTCDSPMYEVTCPSCGDTVTVDENILGLGKIECPGCGNILEFDLDPDADLPF